jgi:nitrite reductase (NADH) small subunit
MENWQRIIELEEIPQQGSRVVKTGKGDLALFRTADDQVFALHDKCPHKGGPLSQGIVFGHAVVCPLHSWKINLENGEAVAPDVGCAGKLVTKLEAGVVFLQVRKD